MSQEEGLGQSQAVVLSLWGLYCFSSCSFCQQSVQGVNSVAQGEELSAPICRGAVWLGLQ